MSKKKSFVLRLDTEMYEALEKWAADEFRSTNGQLEYLISDALKKAGRIRKPGRNFPSPSEESGSPPPANPEL
jgi:hypothetical protein